MDQAVTRLLLLTFRQELGGFTRVFVCYKGCSCFHWTQLFRKPNTEKWISDSLSARNYSAELSADTPDYRTRYSGSAVHSTYSYSHAPRDYDVDKWVDNKHLYSRIIPSPGGLVARAIKHLQGHSYPRGRRFESRVERFKTNSPLFRWYMKKSRSDYVYSPSGGHDSGSEYPIPYYLYL